MTLTRLGATVARGAEFEAAICGGGSHQCAHLVRLSTTTFPPSLPPSYPPPLELFLLVGFTRALPYYVRADILLRRFI
jgi:hypothetical protein